MHNDILQLTATIALDALKMCKSPGVEWLYLTEE